MVRPPDPSMVMRSTLAAALVPGLGHLFQGRRFTALLLFLAAAFALGLAAVQLLVGFDFFDASLGSFLLGTVLRNAAVLHTFSVMDVYLFGVDPDDVSRDQRGMAKTVNFGILYGMSAFRLAREQGVSRSEAQGIIDRYFERYPRILKWKEETLDQARETGRVQTLFGRIRRLGDINSKSPMARKGAERVAINTPVQGSAADIIKKAMLDIQRRLDAELPDVTMVLQVHDELVFEVPEGSVEAARDLVVSGLEGVVELSVPLAVNAASGKTWLEAH